jgi:hypothetical protein
LRQPLEGKLPQIAHAGNGATPAGFLVGRAVDAQKAEELKRWLSQAIQLGLELAVTAW